MVPYLKINNNQPISGIDPIDLSQLDHDFFFHLGEKVSNGMSVTNEANLIKDFLVAHPKEKELILSQWNNLEKLLLGECTQKTIEFILPKEYVRWLRFSDYKPIYDNYYSGVETIPVMIDVKDLYEDVINGTTGLFRTICKKIQEESINSIIIDDCIDIETSTFVQKLKKKYPAVKYLSYSEWKSIQDKEERERQRKIQEQQEEEERLRKIAEKERIAKAEAERLAKEEAERIAKDEEERRKKYKEEQERLQRLKDETLIYNWLVDEYRKLDVRAFVSDEKRIILQRAANDALYRITNVKCKIEIPITYVKKYKGIEPKVFKQTTILLSPAKLGQLRRQAMIREGLSTTILSCGLVIHESQGEYGLVDVFNQIVVPHTYEEIKDLPSGCIRVKKYGKYGLLSSDCCLIIDCRYDEIKDFKRYEIKNIYSYQTSYVWARMGTLWQLLDENGCVCDPKSRGVYLTL